MVAHAEQADLVEGLCLTRVLGRGAHSVVWAAESLSGAMPWQGNRSLVVKLALDSSARNTELLRREARVLARLRSPNIVRLWFSGTADDGRAYLVLTGSSEGTLEDRLRRGALSWQDTLRIARCLALALHEAHRRGVVHRDVKPGNVLLDAGQHVAWLSDFGLASDTSVMGHATRKADVAGSFLYSAPEQTGMLRRAVDGRADLYALGIVLFECLAGRPPFQGAELEVLLQLHATARPPDVRRFAADVPEALARILAKLLAKDPDDRYLTAQSLLSDMAVVERGDALEVLGREHASPDVVEPPLVGREAEVRELGRLLSGLGTGHGGVAWVLGASGSGRARVCRAALSASGRDALWLEAAVDDTSPFAVFRVALSALMRRARSEPAREARLDATLTSEGAALARLFPELPGLTARAEELSFEAGIESLVKTFTGLSSPDDPLVLVIEHADRLGAQELGVLLRLRTEAARSALLVVCTGERNAFAASVAPWKELHLEPLSRAEVESLLRHVLGPLPFDRNLPELALSCSGGIAGRVVARTALALLEGTLETDGCRFQVDEARFVSLDDPLESADVRELSARLAEDERLLLACAALTGRRFEPAWLMLMGFSEELVDRVLWEATQLRVLVASASSALSFVQRELAETLVAQLPDTERIARLRRLATELERRGTETLQERALLARALYESVNESSAQRAWELCLETGLVTLEAFAFAEAKALLSLADELAQRFALKTDFRLPRAFGQLEAQAGHTEAAIAKFKRAIEACPDALERAGLHARCAELRFYNEVGHTAPMLHHLEHAFREMGVPFPRPSPLDLLLALFWFIIVQAIQLTGIGRGKSGTGLVARTRLRLMELSGMYYFWTQQLGAMLRVMMQGWVLARLMGPSRELGICLSAGANFFYIVGQRRRAERYYAEVHGLAEQLGDRGLYAYARYMQATGLMLSPEVQRGERIMMQTLEQQAGHLDISYLGQGVANLATSQQLRGYALRAGELLSLVREQMQARLGAQLVPEACTVALLEHHLVQGRPDAALDLVAQLKKRLSDPVQDPLGWIQRWQYLAVYEYACGAEDAVIDAAVAQSRRSRISARGAVWLVTRGYYVVAHLQLLQWLRAGAAHKPERARALLEGIRRAKQAPKHPHMTGHVYFLRAAEQFVHGRIARAEAWLARAEHEARRWDLPLLLMEAHALRAHMLNDQGLDEAARREARCAVTIGQSLGQVRRVRELEKSLLLSSLGTPSAAERPTSINSLTAHHHNSAQRERDVLVEVAMAASLELEPEAQARVVLDRLIGLLGAERGLIFSDGAGGELVRLAGRSAEREDLDQDIVYAQSLVRRVRDTGVPLVLSGTEEGAGLGSESMVAASLRSMVCAPIRLGSEVRGAIYLDSSLARGVFTRKDLEMLAAMGSQIAVSQEVARSLRVEIERRELDKDLQLSGAVQALLLPLRRDFELDDVCVSAAYTPVSHAGGDLWTYEILPDGRIWVLLGDATGHGASAAMLTAVLLGSFRTLVDRGERDMRSVLDAMARTLAQLTASARSVTMTVLEISSSHEELRVFSAGGAPLLVRAPDGSVEPCVSRGTPLGATPFQLGETALKLTKGMRVLMVTDGILEMPTVEGRELGLRRLRKLFSARASLDVATLRDGLMEDINAARGALHMEDDLTLLLVGRD